jgi:Uma2 family endonuclease
MQTADMPLRRWTREEYDRLVDLGFFQDERLELLDGEIITMTPQKGAHSVAVGKGQRALQAAFGDGVWVRPQLPLAVDAVSEPEPDLAVVPGEPDDYPEQPSSAVLVVEVADTTLRYDRQRKASVYARGGITDYWIVNLIDRVVEVYREPVQGDDGWYYRLIRAYTPGEIVAPLGTTAGVAVADLLPAG